MTILILYIHVASISEVSVSTLKHLAFTKGPHVPSLNNVVPYFDFSSNQEYLVKRIRGKLNPI